MSSQSVHPPLLRFSSETLPPRDRFAICREVLGKRTLRVDIEQIGDSPFYIECEVRQIPGLVIDTGRIGCSYLRRTPSLISDGNDNVLLGINRSGTSMISHLGREVTLRAADAVLLSCGDVGAVFRPQPTSHFGIHVPRAALRARVSNVEDALARSLPHHSEALRLLKNYIDVVNSVELTAPALRDAVANHVYDLIACVIGEMRGKDAPADIGGMRAARLHAIKEDISANILSDGLTLGAIAKRQNISPSYIRKLLETDGTNFTELVLEGRLLHARRLLSDPIYATHRISDIALAAGFGDLSYFNRTFRRRFGYAPSEVRLGKPRS